MEMTDLAVEINAPPLSELLKEYEEYERFGIGFYLSDEEVAYIRDYRSGYPFEKRLFDLIIKVENNKKREEDLYGIRASHAASLFMLLSVHVKPMKSKRKSSSFLSVYGEITSPSPAVGDGTYIYKRGLEDVEKLESSDGYLTLNGPSRVCWLGDVCCLLQSNKLSIRLYDQQSRGLFVQDDPIILEHSGDYFEQVKQAVVKSPEISITLNYVSIPMAVCGRVDFRIFDRERDIDVLESPDVWGKVAYNSTIPLAKYKSQEIVLLDKKPSLKQYKKPSLEQYEKQHLYYEKQHLGKEEIVLLDKKPSLEQYEKRHLGKEEIVLLDEKASLEQYGKPKLVSRCWVVAPACSLLQLHIDLHYGPEEIILQQVVELETRNSFGSMKKFVFGRYFISVCASWFPSYSQTLAEDGCVAQISRSLEPYAPASPQPQPASAIEVFSIILVCHERPLQIHGHLRFTADKGDDANETRIDIFKRGEEDPLALNGSGLPTIPVLNGSRLHSIPVLNGSRLLTDFDTLSMACDLKDTISNSSIRGRDYLNVKYYRGQQLCSIFGGYYGFAALHYAVISSAVQVKVKVNIRQQKGLQSDVFGSICAQYKGFDYSSQYKKDCYGIVLFKRNIGDSADMYEDGSIPLSRSSFVVPWYSSTMLNLDLTIGTQKLSSKVDFTSGSGKCVGKITDGEVEYVLEWSGVE